VSVHRDCTIDIEALRQRCTASAVQRFDAL